MSHPSKQSRHGHTMHKLRVVDDTKYVNKYTNDIEVHKKLLRFCKYNFQASEKLNHIIY